MTHPTTPDDDRGSAATGHIAIVDGPSLTGTYSWFCPEVLKNKCDQEHFDFGTYEDALLDSLDHSGARTIQGIRDLTPGFREVHFGGGWTVYSDGSSDTETVRAGGMYDVVDLDSICDPMGNPG